MSGGSHASVLDQGPSTRPTGHASPPKVPRVQDIFVQQCQFILKKCQDRSVSFAEGLTEIVLEASQAAMY